MSDFATEEPRLPAIAGLALARPFFDRPSPAVAQELVGSTLLVDGVGGIVVETEAYAHHEPASHSFRGPTARNAVMFGAPGHAYVYRSYGIHWCLNVVCAGGAVLIRALQATVGMDAMAARRGTDRVTLLASGPGRLGQALAIMPAHNGLPLDRPPFILLAREFPAALSVGPRIGISRAVDLPWRFGLAGSPFLSRRFPAEA